MAATPDLVRLIINADDLGLTEGVTRGILEAHEAGVVTSASMLVNTPGFDDAVRRVAGHPALSVGLHLNLTVGRPVADPATVASLLDSGTGQFLSLGRLIRRALSGRVVSEHVLRECEAQIGRLRASGVGVTHLDSHRHVHALPGLLQPIALATREAGVRVLRRPVEPLGGAISSQRNWREPITSVASPVAVVASSRQTSAKHWTSCHPERPS